MKNLNYTSSVFTILMMVFILSGFKPDGFKNADEQKTNQQLYAGLEFDMPRVVEPVFPDRSVVITDFGAVGDGQYLNTKSINQAISSVAEQGGGTVVIPAGIWLTGPIELKSNINMYTEAGALVIFSQNFDHYPLIKTSFEGLNTYRCVSPISGRDLENIAFTGKGVWDGSGDAWRPVKKSKMTSNQWKDLLASGGVVNEKGDIWYPSAKALKGAVTGNFNVPDFNSLEQFEEIKDFLRPVMVSLVNCKNVLLDGPTFQNSPAWCIHPLMCENVTIRNLTVRNPWYSQNGDGLDLESCKNAVIHNNNFDVGDDAICIKSGKDADGRDRGIPTENVVIKNNIVYHGHGGFTIGSEMSGGVKNIHVSNCTFIGTDVGLRFKSTRGRGGVVEKVYISDIDMVNIPAEPIRFNLFYGGNSPILDDDQEPVTQTEAIPPVTEETPQFKDIVIRNVVCKGAGQAIYMQGLPEMHLQNIHLENILIEADKGIQCIDANGIAFINVQVKTKSEPVMHLYNGLNIEIEGFSFDSDTKTALKIEGPQSENIQVNKTKFSNAEQQITVARDLKKGVLKVN